MAAQPPFRDILGFTGTDAEEMLRVAVECYGNGQLSTAETILVGLITIVDGDARPVKLLASTLLMQNKHREAETLYERALELDAADPYTLVALGEIKLKALKITEAIPLFEKLFALDPEGKHPAANRGREVVKMYYTKMQAG
jgi:predicted Zn-dependent protease